MKVRIIGDAPVGTVLTGLLAGEKHEVVWNPGPAGSRPLKLLKRRKAIRLVLPQGWICTEGFSLSSSAKLGAEELGVERIAGWDTYWYVWALQNPDTRILE